LAQLSHFEPFRVLSTLPGTERCPIR